MSTTAVKRRLSEAYADAKEFRAQFDPKTYLRWEFAGSIRREKSDISDVEHVVIPVFADVADAGNLFATPIRTNLVFQRLDELVTAGTVKKHIYGTTGFRWGESNRGSDFNGINHEIFTADLDNWGSKLAICTGPAEFSKRLVTGLLRKGMRNAKGYVWECRRCPHCDRGPECKVCDGTGLEAVKRLSVGDEREYFQLCGMQWIEPERRA